MKPLLLFWRLSCVIGHIVAGLATCMLVFPLVGPARRMDHIARWSRRVLLTFGVTVEEAGGVAVLTNALLVANHVSWVDVFIINARYPSHFVAKSEVRRWPLIGPLAALAGTVFVARERPSELKTTVSLLAHKLRAGERIACFPEGTSAAQGDLQPFRANLFEAAIEAGVPVQALAISYVDDDGALHPSVEYIATTSLVASMLAIINGKPIRARLRALPPQETGAASRRALAAATHAQVGQALAPGAETLRNKRDLAITA